MIFANLPDKPLRVLALGAHSDDIEIGCGGTLLRLMAERETHITWVVFASTPERKLEAEKSAKRFLSAATTSQIIVHNFRDTFFPVQWEEIKNAFVELKPTQPHLVFTHTKKDKHQDHRVLCELTWNAFRGPLVLEYEIPKFDGDMGQPNVYIKLSEKIATEKTKILIEEFGTQRAKSWFDQETFMGLMRIRGLESGAGERYAEAFYGHKVLL